VSGCEIEMAGFGEGCRVGYYNVGVEEKEVVRSLVV
jgi:hypothetical protein